MTAEPSSSSVDLERTGIGWRIAKAGDEQDVANFAYDHMDDILADLIEMTRSYDEVAANLEHARQIVAAQAAVVEAGRYVASSLSGLPELDRLKKAMARLDAADAPAEKTT